MKAPSQGLMPFGHNDLQPVAEALCPAIARVAHWLQDRYGNSRMTGSGSAVFAEVSEADRQADAAIVREGGGAGEPAAAAWPRGPLPEGWIGRMCRSLAHHPLRDWAD